MTSASFGRSKRLHGKRGFEQLFRRGKAFRENGLTLYVLPSGTPTSRFGCTVGRTVSSTAVVRNRLKRWLREIFRRNPEQIPSGMNLVIRVHRISEEWTYERMENLFFSLCGRLKPPAG